jgi:pSer/pThr/pTyr-binding forkhead associated (FHA) protein
MAGSQDSTFETATSTENLLPVELTIHDQYGRETRCALHKLPAIVGRDAQAGVQLADPWISHRHCEINQIGDVVVVRDLDSKNGVFVHQHRVRESQVLSGERLTVGRTEIIVRYPGRTQTAIEVEASEPQKQKPSQDRARETVELLY